MHAPARGAPLAPGVEVRRVDDERVAVPVSARCARPLQQIGRERGTLVERDDARGVHHLGHDDDMVRRLEQLHIVVVGARRHRRSGVEPEDAAVIGVEVQPRVGRMVAPVLPALFGTALRAGRPRRIPPVRGVDDQRGPARPDRLQALVEPRVVVGAVPAVGPPVDVRPRLGPLGRQRQEVVQAFDRPLLQVGRLLFGQELLFGKIPWPLHARDAAVVPDTPQVGRAPGGPRRVGLGARGRRRQRRDRDHRRDSPGNRGHSMAHLVLLHEAAPRGRVRQRDQPPLYADPAARPMVHRSLSAVVCARLTHIDLSYRCSA